MLEKLITKPSKLADLDYTMKVKKVDQFDILQDLVNGLHDTANSIDTFIEEMDVSKFEGIRKSLLEDLANVYIMNYLTLVRYSMHLGDEFNTAVDTRCEELINQYSYSLEEVAEINSLNVEAENFDSLEF